MRAAALPGTSGKLTQGTERPHVLTAGANAHAPKRQRAVAFATARLVVSRKRRLVPELGPEVHALGPEAGVVPGEARAGGAAERARGQLRRVDRGVDRVAGA